MKPVAADSLTQETLEYIAPSVLSDTCWSYQYSLNDNSVQHECAVCYERVILLPLSQQSNPDDHSVVEFLACNHLYHESCIFQVLGVNAICPLCRRPLQHPQGCMPSETMSIRREPAMKCLGFAMVGSIVLEYNIAEHVQNCTIPTPV